MFVKIISEGKQEVEKHRIEGKSDDPTFTGMILIEVPITHEDWIDYEDIENEMWRTENRRFSADKRRPSKKRRSTQRRYGGMGNLHRTQTERRVSYTRETHLWLKYLVTEGLGLNLGIESTLEV